MAAIPDANMREALKESANIAHVSRTTLLSQMDDLTGKCVSDLNADELRTLISTLLLDNGVLADDLSIRPPSEWLRRRRF